MTVKQCAMCKKRNGILVEIMAKESPSYRGKHYHATCFLELQGSIHQANDPKDVCEDGQCNAVLFEEMNIPWGWKSKRAILSMVYAKMVATLTLFLLATTHLLSYLPLAFVIYYWMMARIFLPLPYFAGLCTFLAGWMFYAHFRNKKRMTAMLLGVAYLIYYCDAERVSTLYYDVLLMPKIMALLFLCERGIRVCMLLRIVDANHMAKECGALLWTLQAWPLARYLPLYVSLLAGILSEGACYVLRVPLFSPLMVMAIIGGTSYAFLLYPLSLKPRWRIHAEELFYLPF